MNKETGGPAFPTKNQHQSANYLWHYEGMTLRDWFAGQAMQGAIAGCAAKGEVIMYSDLSGLAYEVADAMLKAREQ